jgi:hypothetical protein
MGNVSDCGKWVFSLSVMLMKGAYLIVVAFDRMHFGCYCSQIVECLLVADVARADDLGDLAWNLACQCLCFVRRPGR